jgi:hypothetical protein
LEVDMPRNPNAKLTHPTSKLLTNEEYVCLKMHAHPGQTGAFYRRALMLYVSGTQALDEKNVRYGIMFGKNNNPSKYWYDANAKKVNGYYVDAKPGATAWNLTAAGVNLAKRALDKLKPKR